jgi:hypothetical protein
LLTQVTPAVDPTEQNRRQVGHAASGGMAALWRHRRICRQSLFTPMELVSSRLPGKDPTARKLSGNRWACLTPRRLIRRAATSSSRRNRLPICSLTAHIQRQRPGDSTDEEMAETTTAWPCWPQVSRMRLQSSGIRGRC